MQGLTSEASLEYLGDVIIIGQTFQEQLEYLWKLFQGV
jgi:hypothetical protein